MCVRYSVHAPSFSPRAWQCSACSKGLFWWLSQRRDGAHTGEDTIPTVGCSIAVHYRLALEQLGHETEASAHLCNELSTYCSAATSRMSFNYWYTLLAPSIEDGGSVSKSAAAAATFWLALGMVVCGVPSWLMAMAHTRAWALV
jgi:hypothetical protein